MVKPKGHLLAEQIAFTVPLGDATLLAKYGYSPTLRWVRRGHSSEKAVTTSFAKKCIATKEGRPGIESLRGFARARGECEAIKKNGEPCTMTRGLGWISGASVGPEPRLMCPGHWRSPPAKYRPRPTSVAEVQAERAAKR
jgi:hypothetical protein